MTTGPIFDVRKSVTRRNRERIVIVPIIAALFIAIGIWIVPKRAIWSLSFEALETWNGWGFFGLFLVATGLFHLLKLTFFAFRAAGTSGEWHIRLTQDDLLWQVPDHAHGPEEGFHTPLSAIRQLEHRVISQSEGPDLQEYWIHFHDRAPIQLRDYTGISLPWMFGKIRDAGVPVEATTDTF